MKNFLLKMTGFCVLVISVSFCSYDELSAQSPESIIIINEVRTEYSGSTKRAEYIEFKALKPGNIEGIRVFCASNYKAPMIYVFPAIEVRLNEYIVLHTRKIEDSCLDELGENLELSGGKDACPAARDLWIDDKKELLRKNEVIYITDVNDIVLDALLLSDGENGWNGKTYRQSLNTAALFLAEQNVWRFADTEAPGPSDALDCSSIKTATTKSISRDETNVNSHNIDDWYVTITGGATPGLPNSKRP